MALSLKVPALGESVREATLGVWKRAEGDHGRLGSAGGGVEERASQREGVGAAVAGDVEDVRLVFNNEAADLDAPAAVEPSAGVQA